MRELDKCGDLGTRVTERPCQLQQLGREPLGGRHVAEAECTERRLLEGVRATLGQQVAGPVNCCFKST